MHILIVDDEPPVREILARLMRASGHATKEAGNTQEALDSMSDSIAGVVLCDIQMPGEHDGIWLANELRRRYQATAVVLITAVNDVPPATSLRAGVVAYIMKPFTSETVFRAVKQAVAWHTDALAAGPRPYAADALAAWLAEVDASS